MSSDDIPVTLDLGTVELPLNDLVRLRSGMTIEFERPKAFEGVLRLDGSNWAAVSIEITEERVSLLVDRVFCGHDA